MPDPGPELFLANLIKATRPKIVASTAKYFSESFAKACHDAFTLGLGREGAEDGIRVVGIAPGLTDTEIHARSTCEPGRVERMSPQIPLKRPGTANEFAHSIMFALRDAASYITATTIRVAGGR